MGKLLLLLTLMALFSSSSARDFPRLTSDTIRSGPGENLIVFKSPVTNIMSSNKADNYAGQVVTCYVDSRNGNSLLVSTKVGNYYLYLKPLKKGKTLHDLRDRKLVSYLPVIDFERQFDTDCTPLVQYNSRELDRSIHHLDSLKFKSPQGHYTTRRDLSTSLVLNRIYQDYQLVYYEYLVINNSDSDYHLSMVKVWRDGKLIHPVARNYPESIHPRTTGKILLSFPKSVAGFSVQVGSKYLNNILISN